MVTTRTMSSNHTWTSVGVVWVVVVVIMMMRMSDVALVSCAGDGEVRTSMSSADNSTAYEVLESYGFPAGLLPDTVEGYELDEEDGAFTLYLEAACTVDIPGVYPVRYAATITGTIAPGSLSGLSGITVKVLFVRWKISSITVSDDDLVFKVGPVSVSYPISNFDQNPGCSSSAAHNLL